MPTAFSNGSGSAKVEAVGHVKWRKGQDIYHDIVGAFLESRLLCRGLWCEDFALTHGIRRGQSENMRTCHCSHQDCTSKNTLTPVIPSITLYKHRCCDGGQATTRSLQLPSTPETRVISQAGTNCSTPNAMRNSTYPRMHSLDPTGRTQ